MADLLSWLRACHLRFLEADEKELETYRAYFQMVEDRVVMPCIIPRRESRYDYEEVRRVSEEVKSSVEPPENEFDRHCLKLAFLTNPLLTMPEDDVWFAEQSETLRIQERLWLSRTVPGNLAWSVQLSVSLMTWWEGVLTKERYRSGEYRKLISKLEPPCTEKQSREHATLRILRSEECDVGRTIEAIGTVFPNAQFPAEGRGSVTGVVSNYLFCHSSVFGIAELLEGYEEEPPEENCQIAIGFLIDWNVPFASLSKNLGDLLEWETGDAGRTPQPGTDDISPDLLRQAAETFLARTDDLRRGLLNLDRDEALDALTALVWCAEVFKKPAVMCGSS